ncbi:MAG: BON domain-containing protein [bacterium]|nr:BON domain-containing protein [bacterium]
MAMTDIELHEDVLEELALDPRLDADDIAIGVRGGVVTLMGNVPSLLQKWEAEAAVKRVNGVRAIANELQVELPGMHVRDDADIARSVEMRLSSNQLIPNGVQAVVSNGHVTLSGNVHWHYQLEEAALEVFRTEGVKGLTNLIVVESDAAPSPDDVQRRIHGELQRAADLDAKRVHVAVERGTVRLSGSVRTWLEHDKAVQAAWSVAGVRSVDDLIAVEPER